MWVTLFIIFMFILVVMTAMRVPIYFAIVFMLPSL
jgi:hypothetical protein